LLIFRLWRHRIAMARTPKQIKLTAAQRASDCATARLQGMKLRAELYPPQAAVGGFPYPARTCADWMDWEPTEADRRREAEIGSAKLRDAILALRDPANGSARLRDAIWALAA
jgi:hypothetical protein